MACATFWVEIPNCNGTSTRSCSTTMPTCSSLQLTRKLSMPLARFSKAILRLRLSSITSHWSFFFSGRRQALLWQRSLQSAVGARWSFCLGSLLPKVAPLVSPILLPRIVTSLTFLKSSSACHKVIRLF